MNNTMQKSLLSIVLVILIAFSVLAPAVSAAATEEITFLKVSVYEPERYENPKMKQKYIDNSHVEVISFTWTDDATGELMTEDDTFEYGKSYTADLIFQPKEGYCFTTGDSFHLYYMHGFHESQKRITPVSQNKQQCAVSLTFDCKPFQFEIGTIEIDLPFAGRAAATSVRNDPNPRAYSCTSFRWIDDETGEEMDEDDIFGPIGKTYTAVAVVEAKDGYAFTEKAYIHDSRSNYYERLENTSQRLVGRHTYRCQELINTVYMTITAPVEGEHPDYDPVFPDGVHYLRDLRFDDETKINGVRWKELYDGDNYFGRTMLPTDTFQAGKRYRVDVNITTESEDYYIHIDHSVVNGLVGVKMIFLPDQASFGGIMTCPDSGQSYPLSVYVRSFLSETEPIAIELMQKGEVKYPGTCSGARVTYDFDKVAEGSYTMRISKKNHATRDYSVTVSGETSRSAKLNPLGDINGDGVVKNGDLSRILAHLKGTKPLEGYELACGDINGDGEVKNGDLSRVLAHLKGTRSLWK